MTADKDERREGLGEFGGRELRTFEFRVEDVSESGAGEGQYTVRGHAAVIDKFSLDLGGFREMIAPGAFDRVLSEDPHVLHTWDHDTRYVFSSTRNKTLELRMDPQGLHFWSRVAPTSYAKDLRVLLERGDVSQASFAFTVKGDEWNITERDGKEVIERTITEVGELFDVTTTAMGAYPATDSQLAQRALSYAQATGRLPAPEEERQAEPEAAPEAEPEPEPTGPTLRDIKAEAREAVKAAKTNFLTLDRKFR
jgi:HK97 family phage prohead protease